MCIRDSPDGDPSSPGSPSNPGGTTQPKKHTLTVRSANEIQGSVSGGGTFDEGSTQTCLLYTSRCV